MLTKSIMIFNSVLAIYSGVSLSEHPRYHFYLQFVRGEIGVTCDVLIVLCLFFSSFDDNLAIQRYVRSFMKFYALNIF